MKNTQWDDVDAHILQQDGATLAGYVIGGAILALGVWQAFQPNTRQTGGVTSGAVRRDSLNA